MVHVSGKTVDAGIGLRPLHVGLFTDSNGPGYNGATVAVRQLESRLKAAGHKVAFVAPGRVTYENRLNGACEWNPFSLPSIRIPGVHPAVAIGWGFRRCLRQLLQARLDVIHVHGTGAVSLLGMYLARRQNIPLVLTWHTDVSSYMHHYRFLSWLTPFWSRLVIYLTTGDLRPGPSLASGQEVNRIEEASTSQRHLLRGTYHLLQAADVVTTPSDKATARLLRLDSDVTILTIPAGVDPLPAPAESTDPTTACHWRVNPQLLYVGRLAPEKGIDLLLDAFHLVQKVVPEATLRLVGDYRSARSLGGRIKSINDSRIICTGEMGQAELSKYYDEADAFIFPSTTDTQALVLHEAAHAGLPIVSVDSELLAVIAFGKNAILSRPSPQDLSDAILTMLVKCADEKYREEAMKVGKALAGKYTVASQTEKFVSLYRMLIDRADSAGEAG